MNLLQMSFSGGVIILVIVILRSLLINKLPKKAFLALWAIALLRLLIPLALPSHFSAYSAVERIPAIMEQVNGGPAANFLPIITDAEPIPAPSAPPADLSAMDAAGSAASSPLNPASLLPAIWLVGFLACAIFFAVSYLRSYREFQTALPVDNAFLKSWLAAHPLRRPISVRQSDQISAPLTYGIFRPVILMPKTADWEKAKEQSYVLAHEYTHIRRFDAAMKLLTVGALCLHWFNPMVWVMYILYNRDMELSCDENVVRQFGADAKSDYAMTLIQMEESKSRLIPLCNNFSKNAIQERIYAIMKSKKTTKIAISLAVLLVAGVVLFFATSYSPAPQQNTLSVYPVGYFSSTTWWENELADPDAGYWYIRGMSQTYAAPEDIDLNAFFGGGIPGGSPELTSGEQEALTELLGKKALESGVHAYRSNYLESVLRNYFALTAGDGSNLNQAGNPLWPYLKEGDLQRYGMDGYQTFDLAQLNSKNVLPYLDETDSYYLPAVDCTLVDPQVLSAFMDDTNLAYVTYVDRNDPRQQPYVLTAQLIIPNTNDANYYLLKSNLPLAAAPGSAHTFELRDGSSVTVTMNDPKHYSLTAGVPFVISQDGAAVTEGSIAPSNHWFNYLNLFKTNPEVVLDSGEIDGNPYYLWKSSDDAYTYVIHMDDTDRTIILINRVSEESARACFQQFSFQYSPAAE